MASDISHKLSYDQERCKVTQIVGIERVNALFFHHSFIDKKQAIMAAVTPSIQIRKS